MTQDSENRPLCFAFQTGKCKFKGPPGKRCARGITSATSVVALGISLFTSATTLTEYGIWRFHRYRIQIDLCSWSFLAGRGTLSPAMAEAGFFSFECRP